jgi:hypothetical protein
MKKIILAVLAGTIATAAQAMTVTQTSQLYNGVIASTQGLVLDLNATRIDYLSATASYSSATLSAATFADGRLSTATITAGSTTTYVAIASSVTILVSSNAALAGAPAVDSILVTTNGYSLNGSSITFFLGQQTTIFQIGQQISSQTTTTQQMASAVSAAVNTLGGVTSTVVGSSVVITAASQGTFGNSYGITTSTAAAFNILTSSFTAGVNNSSFTIFAPAFFNPAQQDYAGPATLTFAQGSQWTAQSVASNTAISIMNSVNQFPAYFTASTNTTTTVLIQMATAGRFGNQFTIATSSQNALGVTSTTFQGGQDPASFTINGITKVANIDWQIGTSSVTASTAIVAAINADPVLSQIIIATAVTS